MFEQTEFKMPKKSKVQHREDWLASHGYRLLIKSCPGSPRTFLLKALPVGNTEHGFVPCSVDPDIESEPGESFKKFIERVRPDWIEDYSKFA